MIQARDMERLRKMEAYCTTTKCLRHSILNYFGEESAEKCGNCSNCLEEFEEMDASQAAADVIRCIRTSGQRFGINLIAGTLLGENTAKIRNYRMDQNPVYGRQSKLGQVLIKEVIRSMLERGYLRQTEDKYALLKLTEKSEELEEQKEPFLITYKKAEEKQRQIRKKPAQAGDLTAKGAELFEELRKLRTELARARSVPPYVVASDKTLRDMCLRIPLTEEEMLDVHGMGAKKLEQYGGTFLEKIRSVTHGDRKTWEPDSGSGQSEGPFSMGEDNLSAAAAFLAAAEEQPLTDKKRKGKKATFHLTEEMLERIQYVPEITISDFVAQINDLRDEKEMKRLTIKSLTEMLLEAGCLEQKYQNGYTRKILTEKGREAGIRAEERLSSKGNPYEIFLYTEKGQHFLTELIKEMK